MNLKRTLLKPNISITTINPTNFSKYALEIFRYQAQNNPVYAAYIEGIKCDVAKVDCVDKIPFLPITFLKVTLLLQRIKHQKKFFIVVVLQEVYAVNI